MKQKRRMRTVCIALLLAVCTLVSAGAVTVTAFLEDYRSSKLDLSLLDHTDGDPLRLYAYDPADRFGENGALHLYGQAAPDDDRYTAYGDLPAHLIHAFVAIEDKRFYRHHGVDFRRTVQAGWNYLRGQKDTFGGSTITQQLIKNLTGQDEATPDRKAREIFAALDLEHHADKTQILEAYLNVINLANGCRGVGAAADFYYGKEVGDLTLSECASVAAITNNPARYDPVKHPDENRRRRDRILSEMAEQGYISEADRAAAGAEPVTVHPRPSGPRPTGAPTSWYTDMVIRDVLRDLQSVCGYSEAEAVQLVYHGSLKVTVPVDETLQHLAENYYRSLANFPEGDGGRPQSAFLLMDPRNGDILAVAGAVGEKTGSRVQNYATDTHRPAGSTIKPLTVYAPALERGIITYGSVYEDSPVRADHGAPWPRNGDGLYRGRVSIRDAVAESLNTVAVRVAEEVGLEQAFSFARDQLGMHSLCPAGAGYSGDMTPASLALGQQVEGVTVRELTAAYTVFGEGVYHAPRSYTRLLDRNGRVLLEQHPEGRVVLSRENAAIMTKLLEEVVRTGTAKHIRLPDRLGVAAAGKTGTTQDNCDRWFVGYTPRLTAGVWMGYDYPAPLTGIAGNPCVTVWDELLTECETAYAGAAEMDDFPVPSTVVKVSFCPLSGDLPGADCGRDPAAPPFQDGWFRVGTEPRELCHAHTPAAVPERPDDGALDSDRPDDDHTEPAPENPPDPPGGGAGDGANETDRPPNPWVEWSDRETAGNGTPWFRPKRRGHGRR